MSLFNPNYFGAFGRSEYTPTLQNIVSFDSEDDSHGTPLLFAFFDNGVVLKKPFVTRSAQEAVRFIYSYPIPSIFVSHNLEYDIANLFGWCKFLYCDEFTKSPLLMRVTMHQSKHIFMNSLSYFKGSLLEMGKVIGLPKFEDSKVSALNPKYCIRDAEIVHRYMTKFQNRLCGDMNVPLRLSIGSISMSAFRQGFMDCEEVATYNNPALLEGYYGGRVEVFYRGAVDNGVHVCDINSSYPNVMKNFEYPDCSMLEPSKIKTHKFGLGEFKIRVPENEFLPILPVKGGSGKLFFPIGDLHGTWTYAEIREAVKRGAKVLKELDGVGTNKSMSPFVEFVDHFYGQRRICKDKIESFSDKLKSGKMSPSDLDKYYNEKFESNFLKDILNNLYGKFCQHRPRSRLSRRPIPEALLIESLGKYKEKRVGPLYEYTEEEGIPPKTANYLWGIHVTAYARLELHKHLSNVQSLGGKLLYCDTDSVMFEYGGKIGEKFGIDKTKLGSLDHESFDLGIFRQSKGYLLCNKEGDSYRVIKSASKGVATHQAPQFILDGMAVAKKPMRFKEALVRTHAKANIGKDLSEIGLNVWRNVDKAMKSIDCKRYLKEGTFGVTYPVNVEDIATIESNSQSEPDSWRKLVKEPILGKEWKDNFSETKIPENWFKKTGIPKEIKENELGENEKSFRVRLLDVDACPEGSIFLAGDVTDIITERRTWGKGEDRKTENIDYFRIRLCHYLGEVVPSKMVIALFPVNALKILAHNRSQICGRRLTLKRDEGKFLQIELSHGRQNLPLEPVPKKDHLETAEKSKKMRDALKEFLIIRNKKISFTNQKKNS